MWPLCSFHWPEDYESPLWNVFEDLKRAPHRKVLCVGDSPSSNSLWWPAVWAKAKPKADTLKQRVGLCSRRQEMGFLNSAHTKTTSRLYLRYLGCYSALCIGNSSGLRENKELKTQLPHWNLEAVSSLGPVYPSVWQGLLRHLLHEALWINGMQECWEVHLIPCELKAGVRVVNRYHGGCRVSAGWQQYPNRPSSSFPFTVENITNVCEF